MLIRIDDSILNNQDLETLPDEVVLSLEIMASARREGKHILIAKRETLGKISQCSHLSKAAKETYLKLFNQFSQLPSYLLAVTRHVEVVNPCLEPQLISSQGRCILKVPPSFFNDSELLQKTLLLCENIYDARFYEFISKTVIVLKNINISVNCEKRGGGGSTISVEFNQIQQPRKRFCICIVDSDRIAPNANLGSTANTIRSHDDPNCITTELFILDCREAENLISNSILSELCLGDRSRENSLLLLEEVQNSSVSDLRCFLDIKGGSSMKEIIASNHLVVKSFWSARLPGIPNITNRADAWCAANWQCANNSNCQCKISLGFGPSTLENAVDYLDRNSPHQIAKVIDQHLLHEWEKIGQAIINWCCATRPMRA